MPDSPSISRRQALTAVGVTATGISGYVAGVRSADSMPDWLAGRDCTPSSLATSPTDWSFPRYNRANTGHAPVRAGPDWPVDRTWEREWPVGDVYDLSPLIVADGVVVVLMEAAPQSVLPESRRESRPLGRA